MADDVTVFYNASCSKCRGAVQLLNEADVDYSLVEYLIAPPKREALEVLVAMLIDPVVDLIRTDDPAFVTLDLDPADYQTPDAVVDLLLAHPEVMQRPVVVKGGRALIARPPERVAELLG